MIPKKNVIERIRLLSTSRGFESIYLSNLSATDTQKEAYEKTEAEHVKYFRRTKYSGYQSFLRVLYRRHKNKKS